MAKALIALTDNSLLVKSIGVDDVGVEVPISYVPRQLIADLQSQLKISPANKPSIWLSGVIEMNYFPRFDTWVRDVTRATYSSI